MAKLNDRHLRNVQEGYEKIINLYQCIGNCTVKQEGDRLWNELTKNITSFRKNLSKLESFSYEELLKRFEKRSENSTESCNFLSEQDFPPISSSTEYDGGPAGDWKVVEAPPEEIAQRFPLSVYFRLGETVRVQVLHVISPLEIYVLKNEDFTRLNDVERVLDACIDEVRMHPLTNEYCIPEGACAALIDNEIKRAVIRMKGSKEVQVYLVDLGRTYFLPRQSVFMLPKNVANMAPPLAHYCSLARIAEVQLDQNLVRKFVEKVLHKGELHLRAHGQHHRLYGELVEIVPDKQKKFSTAALPRPLIPNP